MTIAASKVHLELFGAPDGNNNEIFKDIDLSFLVGKAVELTRVTLTISGNSYSVPAYGHINIVYIRNLSDSATLQVKCTSRGGVLGKITDLEPGGLFLVANPSDSGTAGFDNVVMIPSIPDQSVEYFVGG